MCSYLMKVKPELLGVYMISLLLLHENKEKHLTYLITAKFYFGIFASGVEEKPMFLFLFLVFAAVVTV